jgi:hypothetical protein
MNPLKLRIVLGLKMKYGMVAMVSLVPADSAIQGPFCEPQRTLAFNLSCLSGLAGLARTKKKGRRSPRSGAD